MEGDGFVGKGKPVDGGIVIEDIFSGLRKWLSQEPSVSTWGSLCRLVLSCDEEETEVAMAYALQHLESWPDSMRFVPPWYWSEAQKQGGKLALWPLFRRLSFPKKTLDDQALKNIIDSGHLEGITILDLPEQRLSSLGLLYLSQCEDLVSLRSLQLPGTHCTEQGLEGLSDSPFLRGLRHLVLSGPMLQERAILALLGASWLATLESLSISHCQPCEDAICQLLQDTEWRHLRVLRLCSAQVESRGLDALVASKAWPALVELSLSHNALGGGLSPAFCMTPQQHLTLLDLKQTSLTDDDVERLLEAPWLSSIERLYLNENQLTDKGFAALAACERLAGLQALDIGYNEHSPQGIRLLRQSSFLKQTVLHFY
jgi:hypothetical protein